MGQRFYTENPRFYVAVDCVIFGYDNKKLQVLLSSRGFEPFRGQPSLMGGFLQENESLDQTAHRVLSELTGLNNIYMEQVGTFGAIDRDPGARVISTAYYALVDKNKYPEELIHTYKGVWYPVDDLPNLNFDHTNMIKKARYLLQDKISYMPVGFNLLPEIFTLSQLQNLYESILGEDIDKRNFRKRISEMPYIENTGLTERTSSKRPAAYYRFNIQTYNIHRNFKL